MRSGRALLTARRLELSLLRLQPQLEVLLLRATFSDWNVTLENYHSMDNENLSAFMSSYLESSISQESHA